MSYHNISKQNGFSIASYETNESACIISEEITRQYQILRLLGKGSMGCVWLAENIRTGAYYAIKISNGEEARLQLEKEAENLKKLKDRHFPYLIDYLKLPDCSILISEYMEGTNFAAYLKENVPLPEKQALDYLVQLAKMLAILEEQHPQMLYLDLKPSNLILVRDSELALIDFGAATGLELGRKPDTYIGTKGYSAPEQEKGRELTAAADIYAAGAIFNYMLTGVDPSKPPYLLCNPDREITGISGWSGRLLKDCCALKPERRIQNAEELLLRIERRPFFLSAEKAAYAVYCGGLLLLSVLEFGYLYTGSEYGKTHPVLPFRILFPNFCFEPFCELQTMEVSAFLLCIFFLLRIILDHSRKKRKFIKERKIRIFCTEKKG